jgi:hypothetical protein
VGSKFCFLFLFRDRSLSKPGCQTPIGELFDLEALANTCRELGRTSFFVTSSPLHIVNGIASPPKYAFFVVYNQLKGIDSVSFIVLWLSFKLNANQLCVTIKRTKFELHCTFSLLHKRCERNIVLLISSQFAGEFLNSMIWVVVG